MSTIALPPDDLHLVRDLIAERRAQGRSLTAALLRLDARIAVALDRTEPSAD